jgi:hypothetical protein
VTCKYPAVKAKTGGMLYVIKMSNSEATSDKALLCAKNCRSGA